MGSDGFLGGSYSCPSTALCVGTGVKMAPFSQNPPPGAPAFIGSGLPRYVTSTNPAGGARAWHIGAKPWRPHDPLAGAITCPSVSMCVAIGEHGRMLTSTDPTDPNSWTATKLTATDLFDVSCPSQWFCAVIGDRWPVTDQGVWVSNDPAGGVWTETPIDLNGTLTLQGPLGEEPDALREIACGSTSLCVVTDTYGNVFVGTGTPGGYEDGTVRLGRIRTRQPPAR
jgi:hypothetical protein